MTSPMRHRRLLSKNHASTSESIVEADQSKSPFVSLHERERRVTITERVAIGSEIGTVTAKSDGTR